MGPEESTTSNTAEARNQLMKRRNEYLIHACACRDPTCSKPFCIKMKQLLRHARDCKQRSTGKCTACNFFVRLCASHAHECKETKCPVPICANLKQKMRERRQRQQTDNYQLARRRMAKMQRNITTSPSGLGEGNKPAPSPTTPRQIPHTPGKAVGSPNPHTPGDGMVSTPKLTTNTIPPSPANPATPFHPSTPIPKSEVSAPNVVLQPTAEQQLEINMQKLWDALISINPHEKFRAKDYLRNHPGLVPRVVEMLRKHKKDSDAIQLQQEFSNSLMYTPSPHMQQGYMNTQGNIGIHQPRPAPTGLPSNMGMPNQVYHQPQQYMGMIGPQRVPSPSPMYNPSHMGGPTHQQPRIAHMLTRPMASHTYYNQPYGGHPGPHPSAVIGPPPQYHIRPRLVPGPGYPQAMMTPQQAVNPMGRHMVPSGMGTGQMIMNPVRQIPITQYRPQMDHTMGVTDPNLMGNPYQFGSNTNNSNSQQNLAYSLSSRTFYNSESTS